MRFIVSSGSLLKNLQSISGIISANNILPILESFLFLVEDNRLTVVSTDLETTMKVRMDVQSTENGKLCIQSKYYWIILKICLSSQSRLI